MNKLLLAMATGLALAGTVLLWEGILLEGPKTLPEWKEAGWTIQFTCDKFPLQGISFGYNREKGKWAGFEPFYFDRDLWVRGYSSKTLGLDLSDCLED